MLLRNLAIETDHQLLMVKCGVISAMESLFKVLLRRGDKRGQKKRRGKRRSGSPSTGDDEGPIEDSTRPEEAILGVAMEFLENLCLHRHCRVHLMEATKGNVVVPS